MKKTKNGDVYEIFDGNPLNPTDPPSLATTIKTKHRDVELLVEDLTAAGWFKIEGDEQIVGKVELSKEEVEFMECNKHLEFCRKSPNFQSEATDYTVSHAKNHEDEPEMYERLVRAYFNGYVLKRETLYYIKFPGWFDKDFYGEDDTDSYLNMNRDTLGWELSSKGNDEYHQTQFTQSEIDSMRQDERAQGLDLNALKVKVPDNELAD